MIFGAIESFAVEAIVEPDPKYWSVVGPSVAGRVRLVFEGQEVGNFDEPSCVLGTISEHLCELAAPKARLWHNCLSNLSPRQRFHLLDELFYIGSRQNAEEEHQLSNCGFLTNVSEAFHNIKGFIVCPPGELLSVLLRLPDSTELYFSIPIGQFRMVATEFNAWLKCEEAALVPTHA